MRTLAQRLIPFVVGAEGNISRRETYGFWIKGSGTSFREITDEWHHLFAFCDFEGVPVRNAGPSPSIETEFHAWIYRNTDYSHIAHTHPVNSLKILCSYFAHSFAETRLFPDQVVFNGPASCVVPYATPGKELLRAIQPSVKTYMSEYHVFPKLILLKNHGIIACGYSDNEVATISEICEKSAEIFWSTREQFCSLTQVQIEDILSNEREKRRLLKCQSK